MKFLTDLNKQSALEVHLNDFVSLKKVKKGKDVDLYCAFHAPGTPNVHAYVTETDPPDRYLGHRPACKHSPGQ